MGEIEARALVSGRMRPLRLGSGKRVHQIGVPYNYGPLGFARGDAVGGLVPLVMDPDRVDPRGQDDDVHDPARAPRGDTATPGPVDEAVPTAERTKFGESTARGIDMEG